jgi:GNAT superfamily N-acetyltransferase
VDLPSESIEALALADIHAAATPGIATRLGLRCDRNQDGLISVASALPPSAIVINRTLCIGLETPASKASVDRVLERYRDADVSRFFLQIHPDAGPVGLPDWLAAAGLVKARGWQKFERDNAPLPVVSTDLEVRRVGVEYGDAFARIVCDAFDLGDVARPWLARLPGRSSWHVFMSFDDGEPAGTGALFVRDGYAWSDFGATAPAFRRRGSQSVLLARRIEYAIEQGCERIFTCTGEDVAGDPQHSYRNILKMGFEATYLRANYAPR